MITPAGAQPLSRLLLGTRNPAKIEIVRAALEPLCITLLTLDELNIHVEVVEDGRTARENAEKKARAYYAASGMPTLAIDGALHIAALPPDRQPGVWVRRIGAAGGEATDQEVLAYYADELAAAGGESECTWTGAVALVLSPGQVYADAFTLHEHLTSRPKGDLRPGAPLDALTIDRASGRYYVELAWSERPDTQWIREFVSRHMPGGA